MMERLIRYARAEGLKRIEGQVLCGNVAMLRMCRELGFLITPDSGDPDIMNVRLLLH